MTLGRDMSTEKLRNGAGTVRVLEARLSPRVGHDLYEVGEALAGRDGLNQHINQVHKRLDQSKGDKRRTSRQRGLCGSLSGKCSSIFMEPAFLKKILPRSQIRCL